MESLLSLNSGFGGEHEVTSLTHIMSQDGGEHFSTCRNDLMPLCQTTTDKTVGVIQEKHTTSQRRHGSRQSALHRSCGDGETQTEK